MEVTGGVRDFRGDWLIVRCAPRQEQRLARQFKIEGLNHFLPLEPYISTVLRKKTGKYEKRNRIRARWPTYVFVCGIIEDAWDQIAAAASRIGRGGNPANYIRRVGNPGPLVEDLVKQELRMAEARPVLPTDDFFAGMKVKIKRGPFIGYAGEVDCIKGTVVKVTLRVMGAPGVFPFDAKELEAC
jgi:transcription antitermination factor NusG